MWALLQLPFHSFLHIVQAHPAHVGTYLIMGADKLPEYNIRIRLRRILSICITVQHLGNNNLLTVEALVKNSGDNWGAGVLEVRKILPMCYKCECKVCYSNRLSYCCIMWYIAASIKWTLCSSFTCFSAFATILQCRWTVYSILTKAFSEEAEIGMNG